MRIVTNTHPLGHDHGLNLTCATTSAARKYLASSLPSEKAKGDHTSSKPGYFLSEMEILQKVAHKTGTNGHRHPPGMTIGFAPESPSASSGICTKEGADILGKSARFVQWLTPR